MAWQNSAAMVGNGGVSGGSSEAGGSGGQPQGTEYTLQGQCNSNAMASSVQELNENDNELTPLF